MELELLEKMLNRRSVRTYNGEAIPREKLDLIIQAGLLAPSGRGIKPWEFIVVKDKAMLQKLSKVRKSGSGMLEGADCAIVVVGDPAKTDVWTEDCSIAMANMHLMADSMGVGSCWIQGRLRMASDEKTTEEAVRELLHFPKDYKLEAILSLGMTENHPRPHTMDELSTEKVHFEKF